MSSLRQKGFENLLLAPRSTLDLLDAKAVDAFFAKKSPDVVFLAAAKVGGIQANNVFRADFIHENLQIQTNVIWSAHKHDVQRLIFLGSSCIYPRMAPQPMPETCLLSGDLEATNRPYAVAKIAGLELVNSLAAQYGRDYFSVMPTNLFGPGDNFHPEHSHVLPALIRRFVEAAEAKTPLVKVWGTGKPKREFMFSHDCADAITFLAQSLTKDDLLTSPQGRLGFMHVNVGVGEDVSIANVASQIAIATGYKGRIEFDASKPDGTPRKLLDVSYLSHLGWKPKFSFAKGLEETVRWFLENRT